MVSLLTVFTNVRGSGGGGAYSRGGGCSWAIVAKGGPLYGGEVICAFLSLGAYWRKYGICNMNLKLIRDFSCT